MTCRDPKSPATGPKIEQKFTHRGPKSTPRHKIKSQRPINTQRSKIDFQMPNVGSLRLKMESQSLKSTPRDLKSTPRDLRPTPRGVILDLVEFIIL